MPLVLLGEYRNEHSHRNYPFLDEVTMTDADGWTLPTDFLVDAFLYPIDLENGLYLSSIDRQESKLYFSDIRTKKVHGVAVIGSENTAFVYEPDGLERQIGILTFGDGKLLGLQGALPRTFLPAATELTNAAYISLNQEGVRAVKLDDGSIVTGPVKFRGIDGVRVQSYQGTDGEHILEFSILGVAPTLDPTCGGCDFIQEICIERDPGSAFVVSEYADGTLAINTYISLDSICDAQKLQRLPDPSGNLPPAGDDACDDPTEPTPIDPGVAASFCFDIESFASGMFYIVTPSETGEWNPIQLQHYHDYGLTGVRRLRTPARPVANVDDIAQLVESFRDPPELGDALQVGYKGLALYRRPRHA